jgi:hypothetical protein
LLSHRPDDGGSKHLQNVGKLLPDTGATTQKTVIFILAAVRTSNNQYVYFKFFLRWQSLSSREFLFRKSRDDCINTIVQIQYIALNYGREFNICDGYLLNKMSKEKLVKWILFRLLELIW